MNLGDLLEKLVRRGRLLSLITLALMACLVLADIIIPPDYVRFPWDGIGGFAALLGFAGCAFFIAVAKGLGVLLVYKPEDYYGEEHEHDPPSADRREHD
ncbi:MAG: hypothetical protein EA419_01190 [Wenzhouxiangella sp.]|nr:MAG: hypothetical protein EA419_01190 [Wenzhouxiangella sp.]